MTAEVEIRDIAAGLWIWRAEHHHWKPSDDWQPIVTSTFVESRGERLVIDPIVPKPPASELWKRLDSNPPTMTAVIIPDHVRDWTFLLGCTIAALLVPDYTGRTICRRSA